MRAPPNRKETLSSQFAEEAEMIIALRSTVLAMVLSPALLGQVHAEEAPSGERRACLMQKYSAYRSYVRDFQRQSAAIVSAASPSARDVVAIALETQLAANDRFEIAFGFLLEHRPDRLKISDDIKEWIVLDRALDAELAQISEPYKAVRAREDQNFARGATVSAESRTAFVEAHNGLERDSNSPLNAAIRQLDERIGQLSARHCPPK